jgi:hypothetical protein
MIAADARGGRVEQGKFVDVALGADFLHETEQGVDDGHAADGPGGAVVAQDEKGDGGRDHEGVEKRGGPAVTYGCAAGRRPGRCRPGRRKLGLAAPSRCFAFSSPPFFANRNGGVSPSNSLVHRPAGVIHPRAPARAVGPRRLSPRAGPRTGGGGRISGRLPHSGPQGDVHAPGGLDRQPAVRSGVPRRPQGEGGAAPAVRKPTAGSARARGAAWAATPRDRAQRR